MKKIAIHTLGCKVNQYESDSIYKKLKDLEYQVVEGLECADIYILNSCAVTSESERKSRQSIAKMLKLNPDSKVFVIGCASQNNQEQFYDKENVIYVQGTSKKFEIPDIIDEYVRKLITPAKGVIDIGSESKYEEGVIPENIRTRAVLKIQDGCSNYCSYCLIPYLRGESRSRDLSLIVSEAKIISEKTNEIIITGINTSDYRIDGKLALDILMKSMKDINARIRISSLEVNVITTQFLEILSSMKNFVPHFHLSLQSGSDKVLKSMNRRYTTQEYIKKVKLIRKYFKDPSITTDLIIGFPTEGESEFDETLKTVNKCKFFDMHVFPYSQRRGTVAHKKYSPLDKKNIKSRLGDLEALRKKHFNKYISQNINKYAEVIVEKTEGEYSVGYSERYIKVYILKKYIKDMSKIIRVKLVKRYKDGIIGVVFN